MAYYYKKSDSGNNKTVSYTCDIIVIVISFTRPVQTKARKRTSMQRDELVRKCQVRQSSYWKFATNWRGKISFIDNVDFGSSGYIGW